MKHALKTSPDGEAVMVTANGKALGVGDVTQRVLHVLPKLYVQQSDVLAILDKDLIDIEITSTLGVDLVPQGGVIVRQPYPNQRYFVGGSDDIRNGWVMPIPDGVDQFDLDIRWLCLRTWKATNTDDWEVRHLIHVVLQPGTGNTFSMDANCWPRTHNNGLEAPRSPITLFGLNQTDEDFKGRQIVAEGRLVSQDGDDFFDVGYSIEERVVIPGMKLDQVWSIDAFNDEQIHEVRQGLQFKTGNAQHIKNASAEFPADIFVKAVGLARSIPFVAESTFSLSVTGQRGGREQHPACQLMSQWWIDNRPNKTEHKVGFAIPYVRVRDDGQYWCGNHEVPNDPLEAFEEDATAQARIGDVVLLMFYASHEHFTADDEGIHTMLANGSPYMCIGMPAESLDNGEFDEAWYSLKALAGFPDRFPVAWKYVKGVADSCEFHLLK